MRTCDAKADYTLHDTSVNLPCQISGPEARVYDCHTAPSSPTQSPDRSHSCRDLGNARGNGVMCNCVMMTTRTMVSYCKLELIAKCVFVL